MSDLKILTLQFVPKLAAHQQNAVNLARLIKEQTKNIQPDLILLPPYALTGYLNHDQQQLYLNNFSKALKWLVKSSNQTTATIILPHGDEFIAMKQEKITKLTSQHKMVTLKIKGKTIVLCHSIEEVVLTPTIDLILIAAARPFIYKQKDIPSFSKSIKAVIKRKISVIIHHLLHATEKTIFCGGTEIYATEIAESKIIPEFAMQASLTIWENDKQHLKPLLISKLPIVNDFPQLNLAPAKSEIAKLYQALVFCLQSYCYNNGFSKVVLGLSGGIDSALVLALAADAFSSKNIIPLYLPSRYSSKLSEKIAKELTTKLKLSLTTIVIDPLVAAFTKILPRRWKKNLNNTTENLQARIRAVILMAYANHESALLLNTGNKSEAAAGYATLYGDMVGGLALLKDIYKTTVYELAKYRNQISKIIPSRAITRPPTAELAPKQKDSDTLPPYEFLDAILQSYLSTHSKTKANSRRKIPASMVQNSLERLYRSEYKRRQSVAGPEVSDHPLETLALPLTSEVPTD